MRKGKRRFHQLLSVSLIFPICYFIYQTITNPPPPPLLRLNPYQHLLSLLKMTAPTIAFFFKGGERPVALLPYTFFEPSILATTLLLLFLLLFGAFQKGRVALYTGLLWFYLTLSPLIHQPDFGQVSLSASPYLSSISLFLICFGLIEKFVSR